MENTTSLSAGNSVFKNEWMLTKTHTVDQLFCYLSVELFDFKEWYLQCGRIKKFASKLYKSAPFLVQTVEILRRSIQVVVLSL